jgi:hypothetical protein
MEYMLRLLLLLLLLFLLLLPNNLTRNAYLFCEMRHGKNAHALRRDKSTIKRQKSAPPEGHEPKTRQTQQKLIFWIYWFLKIRSV